jgi:hypothetical protein
MSKLSIVILNFNRPDYIKNYILPKIISYNNVDEIIISHGKEETFFNSSSSEIDPKMSDEWVKIKNLKHWEHHNKNYGLALRFLSALEAKNPNVIIMDDDIIPSEDTVDFLKEKIDEDPQRIYGIYGRNINDKNEYSYTNYFGTTPIVLTRCLITTKEMCKYFIDNFRSYETDLVKNSKPYWNGEDILFSLLSIQKHGKLPKAYNLKHDNRVANYLDIDQSISIGKGHNEYRKELTKYLMERMEIKDKIKEERKIKHWKTQVSYFVENSFLYYFFYVLVILVFIANVHYYIIRI